MSDTVNTMNTLLGYDYFASDTDMEVELNTTTQQTHRMQTDSETEERRHPRATNKAKKERVKFLTNVETQTDSIFLFGQSVCLTGPVVDQFLKDKSEIEEQIGLTKLVCRQLEKSQKRIALLEKELLEKEVETVSCQLQTHSLQTAVAINEQIIEEFTEKIRAITEELARDRIARETDYESDIQSVD